MLELLLAASAVAGVSASVESTDLHDLGEIPVVIVEGRRSANNWEMPELDYDEPAICPALVESELPGFGTMRIRRSCASDRSEEWRLFQY